MGVAGGGHVPPQGTYPQQEIHVRKVLPAVMSGLLAASFSQIAAAQPEQAGATVIQQRGTQNSSQIGDGNQSTQVYGNENQSNTQSGTQGQSDTRSAGEAASAGASSDNGKRERGNKGLHKGWEKKKENR